MTFAQVSLCADDLETLDRCAQELLRLKATEDFLALGALTMRLRGAYFAALPNEEFSRRVPERFDTGPLRVIEGGAA